MDQNPIINVLALADLLPESEQLVTTMRKAGFRVHAEAVRDERWLRERLLSHTWDLLFIRADNTRISAQQLGAVFSELQPDLLCLVVGNAAESLQNHIPQALGIPDVNNLDNLRQASLLLRILTRELHNLQTHRELLASNTVLKELQRRHQLLLTGTSDAVAYLHDGIHVYVNPAYANLFGHVDPATLLNTAFLDLLDDSAVEGVRDFLRQENCTQSRQHRLRAVDATGLPLELWLQCDDIVYHSEQALQVILNPANRSGLRQTGHDHPQPLDPRETLANTPHHSFLPEMGCNSNDTELLQLALHSDDFELLFQPVSGFMDDGLERYAVSIRIPNDILPPARLLTAANRLGLDARIDRLVLSRCLHLLHKEDRPGLRLVVSLTHASMLDPGFLPWLHQQLQDVRPHAERLILQLSELDIVGSSSQQVAEFCQQLQALQTPLSVSHFGGSLDPFSYLPQQHATYVGLDQSLVDGIDSDSSKFARLQGIVNRLQSRGLLIVSGVDKMELLPALWEARVNFVQGDCLQEACTRMDFTFAHDEEVTLAALH